MNDEPGNQTVGIQGQPTDLHPKTGQAERNPQSYHQYPIRVNPSTGLRQPLRLAQAITATFRLFPGAGVLHRESTSGI